MPSISFPRRLAPLVGVLTLSTVFLPGIAQPVAAAGGAQLVDVANGYRAGEGLGPVALHAVVDRIAVERGRQLVRDGELGHDFEYIKLRFAQEGICWRGFGEIVAYNGSGDYARFGQQWWNSAPHKAIMLGDYTHAGGSREADGDGRWYAVMIFVKLCGAPTPAPVSSGGFTDISDSKFEGAIVWLAEEGITNGCGGTLFCPKRIVDRDQMASFLARALNLPATSRDYFTDDEGNVHEANINRFAAAGITHGCGGSLY